MTWLLSDRDLLAVERQRASGKASVTHTRNNMLYSFRSRIVKDLLAVPEANLPARFYDDNPAAADDFAEQLANALHVDLVSAQHWPAKLQSKDGTLAKFWFLMKQLLAWVDLKMTTKLSRRHLQPQESVPPALA